MGLFKVHYLAALLAATGMVLGAAYMLWLYRRVVFGELVHGDLRHIVDVNRREMLILTPLVLLVLWMGIYPAAFFDVMDDSVVHLLDHIARETSQSSALLAAGEGVQ